MMLLPAVGSLYEGSAKAAQYKGEAVSHDYAADVAGVNASIAYAQGSQQEEMVRRQGRRALGVQRAAIAQSGTGTGGSNAMIAAQSSVNAELDALNVRYGADVKAAGYLNEAQAERYNAKLSRNAAKSAKRLGYLNATTALVNSASDFAKMVG